MRPISQDFSSSDLRAVEDAVRAAEAGSSGEIVTYIAARSDEYHSARWRGATYGALLGALVAVTVLFRSDVWGLWVEAWLLGLPLVCGALGYVLPLAFDSIRYSLVDSELLEERVYRRAREVFLQEEVFDTQERTGILIYVSVLERRVEVLADSGIRLAVPPLEWEEVAALMEGAFAAGTPGAGLVSAVQKCGSILESFDLQRRSDDANELADSTRLEEGQE
jgi:putative membrane protein